MKILRLTLRFAAVSAALAVGTTQLAAQTTTGNIGGRVVGATGQGVDNVQIQIVNAATGLSVGANSRTDGSYIIVGLEVGDRYRVTVRRIGFAPQTVQPVRVTLGQTTPVNFTLSPQASQLQTVTIEAAAENAIIAPSQKGTSTTISDTLLRKLPTLTRNFTDFVQAVPQVSTSGPGLSGGGVNNRYNNIQIDGATEKDLFGLGSTGQPGGQAGGKSIGLDAVKEFQVLLAPYDVRVGNFAGLSVNAVTKSGTNDFHGSAYVYQRNDDLQRKETYLGNFYTTQYGVSVGGPIVKDKVFFFVNPEFQKKAVPASGVFVNDGTTQGNDPTLVSSINTFRSTLGGYGLQGVGDGGKINNNNPLSNVFARLDFALPYSSTLVLRDNYAHAEQQVFSRSTTGTPLTFPLSDNLYQFTSEKNAPVAQLRTNFSNGSYNELIAAYTRIRDQRATPGTLQPQIDVTATNYLLRAGTEASSQANALDQDIKELTDNYTLPLGSSHRLTIGASGQWYKVRNLFGANSVGYWTFSSLDSLASGHPTKYQVSTPVTGDGAVHFRAGQFGGYLQDDYTATPNLNFSLGVRFDAPVFFDKPPTNPAIQTQFNRNTADVPSGNIQASPRFGFNWNVTGDSRNQIRGGVGVFQSAPAYVWLSNSFQNSGGVSGFASLTCNNAATSPVFSAATEASAPSVCADGTKAAAGAEADLLRKDLKFPQTMRGNLAYDRDLGHGFVGGVEGIYTRFLNSLFYTNIALQDAPIGTGFDGRSLYGTAAQAPQLKVTGRTAVYDVQNESKDYSYSFTGSLQKRFTTNFGGSIAYTYTQAYSIQDQTSSTAASQWGFGRQISGSQNSLDLAHSIFETPHRIVSDVSYSFSSGTSLSMIYTGQSGINFDYVSSGDLNGDGRTGNDLLYVPTGPTDPKFPTFAVNGSVTPAQEAQAFDSYISSQDCLSSQRGTIMKRNSCRTPWTNEFDVSVEQGVQPLLRALSISPSVINGQNLSIRLDVINLGNLLNKNWGRQISTSNFSPVSLYTQKGIVLPGTSTTTTLDKGVPQVTFNPAFAPFTYNNVFSNYGMQVSLRYAF